MVAGRQRKPLGKRKMTVLKQEEIFYNQIELLNCSQVNL
jgi:hypothetical protein